MDWEFSMGFYPGVLFGMRTYREQKRNNHLKVGKTKQNNIIG